MHSIDFAKLSDQVLSTLRSRSDLISDLSQSPDLVYPYNVGGVAEFGPKVSGITIIDTFSPSNMLERSPTSSISSSDASSDLSTFSQPVGSSQDAFFATRSRVVKVSGNPAERCF